MVGDTFKCSVVGVCSCVRLCPPTVEEGAPLPGDPSPDQILEFKLKVKCKRNPKAPKGSEDPNELYLHSKGMTSISFDYFYKSISVP